MAPKSKNKRERMITAEFIEEYMEETKRIKVEEPAPPPSHNTPRHVNVLDDDDEVMTDPVDEAVQDTVDQEMHDVGNKADKNKKGNTSTGGFGLDFAERAEGSEIESQRMRTENRRLQEDIIEGIKGIALGRRQ